MGKFSRNREYTFVSMEEFISSVVEEFDDGQSIDIALPWDETSEIITALISTGKFTPYDIEYAHPDINDYYMEYYLALTTVDGEAMMFVEPAYSEKHNRYIHCSPECSDITFISAGVSTTLYDKFVDEGFNTVLYDIED